MHLAIQQCLFVQGHDLCDARSAHGYTAPCPAQTPYNLSFSLVMSKRQDRNM